MFLFHWNYSLSSIESEYIGLSLSFCNTATARHYAYLKPCFDPLYLWVSFWSLQDMSEWKFRAIIRFSAAAPCHFSKVLLFFAAKMPFCNHICVISLQNLWWQDVINLMSFVTKSFLGKAEADWLFLQDSVPPCWLKDGQNGLILLWTSTLFLIHQQMAVENSLLSCLQTKGLTNDPNNNKEKSSKPSLPKSSMYTVL